MTEEPKLIISALSQEVTSGNRTVKAEIYRLETQEEWTLEIEDEYNNSTVWEETFKTESAALLEAKKSILAEGVKNFIGPENGKGSW